jgi:hypothetical protein
MSRTNRDRAAPSPPITRAIVPISGETSDETHLTDPRHREKQILEIIQARAARPAFLNVDIFHDPAWDMLLALFAANLGGRSMTVGSLCLASRIPESTAKRYIKYLGGQGLLLQEGEEDYEERGNVQLSKKGIGGMESYFDHLNSGKFPEVISASKH